MAYTTIEQSKKLVELGLSFSTADMCYSRELCLGESEYPVVIAEGFKVDWTKSLPCWSLAALLSALPKIINNDTLYIETSAALWHIGYRNIYTARADNLVDACVAMIEKLNELNLL